MNTNGIDDTAWEVPAYEVHDFAPKRTRYAIVIPVINEGERILTQLRKIQMMKIHLDADVILADGGSTDGSTEHEGLAGLGVNTLLVKTGPGRLSAQLRMAYAYGLKRGYEGFVTVDGNGKDGVDAIRHFLEALEEGYGYLQGSRYIQGGEAVNTPLDRKLAGRLIHAPMLSLASRTWLTDTTNGFRGYSAKLLLDPRLQPFRDVFHSYSLLFYVTARAARLGYKVKEIPVYRAYPDTGKTPTKIAGFSSRFKLFGELFLACTGHYIPKTDQQT